MDRNISGELSSIDPAPLKITLKATRDLLLRAHGLKEKEEKRKEEELWRNEDVRVARSAEVDDASFDYEKITKELEEGLNQGNKY